MDADFISYLEDVDEIIDELYKVESLGRSLATKRDEKAGDEDYAFLDRAVDVVSRLDSIAEKVAELAGFNPDDFDAYTTALEDAVRQLVYDEDDCEHSGMSRGECLVSRYVEEALEKVDEASRRLFGKRCTWLRGNVEKYTLTAAYNDIAACVHRLAEALEKRVRRDIVKIGKCFVRKGSDEKAVEACLTWDAMSNELDEEGKYEGEDADALAGFVRGRHIELRVGSAPGHAAHIDLERGVVEYYDNDQEVNTAMYKLLSEIPGLKCHIRDDGVTCTGVNSDNVDVVAATLSAATSMDFRIENPTDYHSPSELIDMESYIMKKTITRYLAKAIEKAKEMLARSKDKLGS